MVTHRRSLLASLIASGVAARAFAQGQTTPLQAAPPPGLTTRPPCPTATGPSVVNGQKVEGENGCALTADFRDRNPANGQQKDHAVLAPEERAKGFVRPVRTSYTHLKCSSDTSMPQSIAETFARNPKFYSTTFCVRCRDYFPLAQFVWKGTQETVGS